MDYGTYDPASAQDMLTDVVPSQPQTMLPMARRARLLKLQQQAAEMEGAQPDVSQLQEFARMQGQAGEASMLNALAAQYAGEQFQPVQAQFLKRAMAAQEPMKVGGGMLTPDGKFIRDPFAAQERGLSRLDRLIQSEQGAITAEEAAALRRADAEQRRLDSIEAARQRQEDARARLSLQQQMIDLRRDASRGGPKAPSGYRWAIGADGTPELTFIPGGPADPANKPTAAGSEDERKAAGWFAQADFARNNMLAAIQTDPNSAMPTYSERVASMIPGIGEDIANKIRNESRQRFLQASSSFAEATLRAATGAGVTMDEAKQKAKELTPQIGDSDEVIKQKIAAQEMYLEALKVRAGRALPASVQQIRNQPPAPVGRAAPGLPPEEQAELDRLRAKYRRNP